MHPLSSKLRNEENASRAQSGSVGIARLAGEQKRADAAVAKKSVMSGAKDEALHKANMVQQRLTRLQEKCFGEAHLGE